MRAIKFMAALFYVFLLSSAAFSATGSDICSSVGLTQYRPSGSCGTIERTCCRNGYFSEWGQSCTGKDNCTAQQYWNGYSCVLNCSIDSVKAANKFVCCAGAAESDNICYKDCYQWSALGSGTQNCYYYPTTMMGCYGPGEIYYNGAYCLNGCKSIFESLSSLPCASAVEGDECSKSDYNNYGSDGKIYSAPCNRIQGEEFYHYGYEEWVTVARITNFNCTKKRCKNGW